MSIRSTKERLIDSTNTLHVKCGKLSLTNKHLYVADILSINKELSLYFQAGAPVKTKSKDKKTPANPLADKIVERIGAARDSIKVALESKVPAKANALEDRIAIVEEENRGLKSQLESKNFQVALLDIYLQK